LGDRPDNFWVLNTLVAVLQRQGSSLDGVKDKIPYNNSKLQENLAMIYFRQENYENALKILNGIKNSVFSKELTSKINNSIRRQEKFENQRDTILVKGEQENPMDNYLSIISGYLVKGDIKNAEAVSVEAMEIFPAQPYFYYAYGFSLNKRNKHKEAIAALESGLDYLLDDVDLANKMYKELADANNALGNSSKANMYLSKIKTGS
jgi:tetratricopeptide (TPR) repeat protein